MPDNPSKGRPVGDPSGDVPTEGSIDDLLADAADLAADLSEEVGADPADNSRSPARADLLAQDHAEQTNVDQQLDHIESLLDAAGADLGAEPLAPETENPPQVDVPMSLENASPQPDMLQSACPSPIAADDEIFKADDSRLTPDDVALPSDDAALPSVDAAEPDIAQVEPPLDVDPSPLSDDLLPAVPQAEAAFNDAASDEPDGPMVDEHAGPTESPPPAHTALGRSLDRAADVLDLLDRPVSWIGCDARRLIGWAALATLLVALCVLILTNI